MSISESTVARVPGAAIEKLQNQMPHVEYPLRPSYMKPAVIKKTLSMVVTGIKPFAIVGDDSLSLEWLKINRAHLKKIGSVIYVVSAKSFDSVQHIKAVSGIDKVLVLPQDKDLAENLGVSFYPVLLDSAAGVIRQ